MPVRVVEGAVQHYDWGDTDFIPKLLGVPSRGKPWAELWLGTHANGPTTLDDGTPLQDLTGELAYLLKVLSAAQPLSMQCHPNEDQARDGFERGIYPDPNAKPELLVALTEFEALCGLRPPDDIIDESHGTLLAAAVSEHGTAGAFERIYRGLLDAGEIVEPFRKSSDARATLIARLIDDRDEVSAAASLLLNHVVLQPGEALHLTAGNVHAYIRGSGIELMGASDNVVRAGMTTKHIDVDELLRIFDRDPLLAPVMDVDDGRYPLPEAGVVLVKLEPGDTHRSTGHELAVALDGTTLYLSPGTQVYADSVTYVVTSD